MRQRAAAASENLHHPIPVHRQWPWRALAFSSDFSILAHMIHKPRWGIFGWFVAIPYYAYGLAIQPNKEKRKEEAIYQATANGILPFLHIKLGTVLGHKLGHRVAPKLVWPFKLLGGVAALAALTPTIGDPIGEHLIEKFRNRTKPSDSVPQAADTTAQAGTVAQQPAESASTSAPETQPSPATGMPSFSLPELRLPIQQPQLAQMLPTWPGASAEFDD